MEIISTSQESERVKDSSRRCLVYDIGHQPYLPTLDLQLQLHAKCKVGEISNALILVEHSPPVITFGVKADPDNLLLSESVLKKVGIELVQTDRGGDITYHGPGQLVGYPIINLKQTGNDVHKYLRLIEQIVIDTLANFGLSGHRNGLAGVWVDQWKVCSIGIAVRGSVTYHGFALNVCPLLEHFGYINPCGLKSEQISTMERLTGSDVHMAAVKASVLDSFSELFHFDLVQASL